MKLEDGSKAKFMYQELPQDGALSPHGSSEMRLSTRSY